MDISRKSVLVTGADGFIGSHLTEMLVARAGSVRAFVQYNSFNSAGWLDSFSEEKRTSVEIIAGDIRDARRVDEALSNVDIVFHLAALIAIPYSYNAPDSYLQTNVGGTLNVLQAALQKETEKVVVTSTSEVYGTALEVPITEKHPLQAQSPYSASKIAADRFAQSFHCSYGLPVVIARPFNTYGPRQSERAFIPTVISQLLGGANKVKLGDTSPTRDLVFCLDTAAGFLALAQTDNAVGQEVNICTQQEHSVGDVAQSLVNMIRPSAEIVLDTKRLRPKKSEVQRLLGSSVKIGELTSWRPAYSLEDGLKETVTWFKEHQAADNRNVGGYVM